MTSRKRPLGEISQAYSTPARYAPSTPHARRALQERSGAKQRSAHSIRHPVNRTSDTVRPDGSARNILRQFARITAPITKKRVSTPIHKVAEDKENQRPDENEDDSVLLKRPTLALEDSIEEEDSELPVAPTPSVLPEDDEEDQPTITFQNLSQAREERANSERVDRRKSIISFGVHDDRDSDEEDDDNDGADATIMTERGRRAISEEVTGRFSRYSFGSIRMSDFGTELEIRRESNAGKRISNMNDISYVSNNDIEIVDIGGDTENLKGLPLSPESLLDDENSIQIPGLGDETFNLQLPDDEQNELTHQLTHADARAVSNNEDKVVNATSYSELEPQDDTIAGVEESELPSPSTSRRQTLLETATTVAQKSRRKKVKLTRHGTEVPSLPASLIKWIATKTQTRSGRRRPKFGRDHLKALEQATEWYFEQVGEDLAAYSSHGRRKKRIDNDDMLLLMRRQKVLSNPGELSKLAKEWLPKDIWKELDLPNEP